MVQMSESCLPLSALARLSLVHQGLFIHRTECETPPCSFFLFFSLVFKKKKISPQTSDVLNPFEPLLRGLDCERGVARGPAHQSKQPGANAVDDPLVYGASQDHALARAP